MTPAEIADLKEKMKAAYSAATTAEEMVLITTCESLLDTVAKFDKHADELASHVRSKHNAMLMAVKRAEAAEQRADQLGQFLRELTELKFKLIAECREWQQKAERTAPYVEEARAQAKRAERAEAALHAWERSRAAIEKEDARAKADGNSPSSAPFVREYNEFERLARDALATRESGGGEQGK